jgi:GNAT superfamily N-acetyltransferase
MITIRPVRPDDATALASMFGRCSAETRYRRFHGVVTEMPASYMRRCLDGEQRALVAQPVTGGLVGLASAGPALDAPHVHEAGVLVEDAWQRRGIGRALLAGLFAGARDAGAELVRMELCRAQPSLIAYVIAHAHVVSTCASGCDVTVDVLAAASLTECTSPSPATATAR